LFGWSSHRPLQGEGRERPADGRSDGLESTRRPHPVPRQQRPDRWTGEACLRLSASAIATRRSNARTKGTRFSSSLQPNHFRFHASAALLPDTVQRSNISISCSQVDLDDEKSTRMRASARDPGSGLYQGIKADNPLVELS